MKCQNFCNLGSLVFGAGKRLFGYLRNGFIEDFEKNKRDFRADGLPLHPSALRPRLLRNRGEQSPNVAKIVAMSTILPIFGVFCGLILNSAMANSVSAASLSLTFPSEPITLDLDSSAGEDFKESALATFSASASDVDFGYTLSIAAKDDNTLKNGANVINPIAGTLTPETFASQAGINTWGYLPNKLNSLDNTDYQPGPTKESSVIEKTSVGDGAANPYSFKIAAKIDSSLPTGQYANTFILTLVANKVSYSITYNLNSGTWTGASPEISESTESTTKISDIAPTKNGFEFLGWCTNSTTDESCSGTTIQPGGTVDLVDGSNDVQLYAMWKSTGPPTCNTTGVLLKDNKCWSKEDVSSSIDGRSARNLCESPWRLPSRTEFSNLILAYYPSASQVGFNGGYTYRFNEDASLFTSEWGAESGGWWSSTEPTGTASYANAYDLYLTASLITSNDQYNKSSNNQVRCVSQATYTITYDTSGGGCSGVMNEPDPQTVAITEEQITLSDKQPYSCPYNFVAWCTAKPNGESCPGQQYEAGASLPLTKDNLSITLYAMWRESTDHVNCEPCVPPGVGGVS